MKIKSKILKRSLLKTTLLMTPVVLLMLSILSSCNNQKKPEDTKQVAEEHNDAKFDNTKEKDAQFLVSAAEMNLQEISLGQLAQSKGTMAEVKALGKMMEMENNSTLKNLQALAAKKQITLPTSVTDNGKDAYKKLMDKPVKDFDKAYSSMMVEGQKEAIDKFEKASATAEDADIKSWAASMLPPLRMRLDKAINCEKMK